MNNDHDIEVSHFITFFCMRMRKPPGYRGTKFNLTLNAVVLLVYVYLPYLR